MSGASDSDVKPVRAVARDDALRRLESGVVQSAGRVLMSLRHDTARVAISLAQRCTSDLIESYKAKCAEAEDYDQQVQEAVTSRLSFQQRVKAHARPDLFMQHISTIEGLAEENRSLRDRLFTSAREHHEMEQFKAALCYQNPTAYECFELRKQLAAQARQLDHNTSLFHCEQQRRYEASQLSSQAITDMAKQLEIKESTIVTLSQENQELRSNLIHIQEAVQLPKAPARAVGPRQAASSKIAAHKPANAATSSHQHFAKAGPEDGWLWSKSTIKGWKRQDRIAAREGGQSKQLPQPHTKVAQHSQQSQPNARKSSNVPNQNHRRPQPRNRFSDSRP